MSAAERKLLAWPWGDTARGSVLLPGYDQVAGPAVILAEYGGVPQYLHKHGYPPGGRGIREMYFSKIWGGSSDDQSDLVWLDHRCCR